MCCGSAIRGAVGLAKVALGVDQTKELVARQRRLICRECPHMIPHARFVMFRQCGLCKCFISAKTAIASERCPMGKW
jgi:hypothetical protein